MNNFQKLAKPSKMGICELVLGRLVRLKDELHGFRYYIAFDYVVDNQDIRNKYRMLKSTADKAEGKIIILDMICFEYLILAFDKLVAWTV